MLARLAVAVAAALLIAAPGARAASVAGDHPLGSAGAGPAALSSTQEALSGGGSQIVDDAVVDRGVLAATGDVSVLVHVRPGRWSSGVALARRAGLDLGSRYPSIDVFVAYGPATAFRALAAAGPYEYLEVNRPITFATATSHVATRGKDVLDGAVKTATDKRITGRGVGVAVIDSGVDGTHPDLVDRMGGNVKVVCTAPQVIAGGAFGGFTTCRGPKTFVALADTDTPAAGGHGTHVAGTVAGTGSASDGRFHGAAPRATIYGVGVGTAVLVENALDGLQWVLDNHDLVTPRIRVVNNSWASGPRSYSPDDPIYSAVYKLQDALVKAGVVVVMAAGNEGGSGSAQTTSAECVNPTPGVVCVADYDDANSGTRSGSISETSSRGASDDPRTWPDISAPGTEITSTCRLTLPVCSLHLAPETSPPNLYATLSGTSMATPHVSGIAAQLLQVNSALTPAEVERVLKDTAHKFAFGAPYVAADPTHPGTSSHEKGHGLVDALAAVQALLAN